MTFCEQIPVYWYDLKWGEGGVQSVIFEVNIDVGNSHFTDIVIFKKVDSDAIVSVGDPGFQN